MSKKQGREHFATHHREFIYIVIIFLLWQAVLLPRNLIGGGSWIPILSLVGGVLTFAWIFVTYAIEATKSLSKYSSVLIKINLKQRFFAYFVTPNLFYWAVTLYMISVRNMYLRQAVVIISAAAMYMLLVHIKASYEHDMELKSQTKYVFLLIDLILFYIAVTGYVMSGSTLIHRVVAPAGLAFLLLTHQLMLHKELHLDGIVNAIASALLVAAGALYFVQYAPLAFTLFITVLFYMILNWWGLKFDGRYRWSDYLPPILYASMAWIILFSF